MKKLTIGSLKYDSIKHSISPEQPNVIPIQKNNDPNTAASRINNVLAIEQNQHSFQVKVQKGQSILDAALEQNLNLEYSCKKGTCGKCKVKVVGGGTYLQPVNSREEKKLHYLTKSGYRLACQAIAK
ncbi:2Fe-2S iron-sulfur cluster-binding protein [Niallia oryzisoli]|uniref:2Fe-2S iron-sulfur cluster-binding protein n=1 Tax=Niallia oryzisoli TaxID=1737571 RepID=UPI003735C32B